MEKMLPGRMDTMFPINITPIPMRMGTIHGAAPWFSRRKRTTITPMDTRMHRTTKLDKDPPVHIIQKRIVPARHVHKLRNFQEKPEMRTQQNQRGKADPEIAQKRALCFYKSCG